MITETILKDSAKHAELAEAHVEALRRVKQSLVDQVHGVTTQLHNIETSAKGLRALYVAQQEAFDKQTDKWVEEQGVLGAMKIHPAEFTADEIIAELTADNLEEMTVDIAKIITRGYPALIHSNMEASVYYVVEHALKVLA